jgi:hypothetical protein
MVRISPNHRVEWDARCRQAPHAGALWGKCGTSARIKGRSDQHETADRKRVVWWRTAFCGVRTGRRCPFSMPPIRCTGTGGLWVPWLASSTSRRAAGPWPKRSGLCECAASFSPTRATRSVPPQRGARTGSDRAAQERREHRPRALPTVGCGELVNRISRVTFSLCYVFCGLGLDAGPGGAHLLEHICSNLLLVRQAKLGASCRVQVPVG